MPQPLRRADLDSSQAGQTDRSNCIPPRDITRAALILTFLLFASIDVGLVHIFSRNWLNADLKNFFLPWYQFILAHGRFKAFATSFSDYTPPYLYLLSIGTLTSSLRVDPTTVIRSFSVAGNLIAGVLVYLFAKTCEWSREGSILVALIFVALPEIVVNSFVWGQSDIIYTLFILAFLYFVTTERSLAASTVLGVAFAFKLQTVFIGPFVLYLLLVGVLRWRHLLIVPLVYVLLMTPAALTGRSWGNLLTIYARQAGEYELLSLAAPVPYLFVQMIFPPGSFHDAQRVGVLLAAIVALALVWIFFRIGRTCLRENLLLMATLSLTVMPYVLPMMHERYFFAGGAVSFLLAVACLRTWPIVLLIQTANLCAYTNFLLGYPNKWPKIGAIIMTCAIGLLLWKFFRETGWARRVAEGATL